VRPDHLQKLAERWFSLLEYLTFKIVFYGLLLIGLIDLVRRHVK
jgi:hypothetical protein